MLLPGQFSIFTSKLDARIDHTISKFATDTELGGAVDSLKVHEALQRDVDRSEHWAFISRMKCNESKCWIRHHGQSNAGLNAKWERRGWRTALQKGT